MTNRTRKIIKEEQKHRKEKEKFKKILDKVSDVFVCIGIALYIIIFCIISKDKVDPYVSLFIAVLSTTITALFEINEWRGFFKMKKWKINYINSLIIIMGFFLPVVLVKLIDKKSIENIKYDFITALVLLFFILSVSIRSLLKPNKI